jgi:uncharacterized membrane protein
MNSRLPKWLFVALAAYGTIHFAYLYPQLPAVVASHFDARGAANGWQSKQAFFVVFAAVTAVGAFLIFAVPAVMAIVPRQYVNLPNKDYWLAPERLAAAHQFLSAWFAWYGCAVYGVIFAAFDYAVKWNLGVTERPDPAHLWYALAAFGAFTLAWGVRLLIRFARVPGGSEMR